MITILGLGFVGLTTGLGFAKKGFRTYGFDIDEERISQLKNHTIPFHEPHLDKILIETYNKTFFLDASFEEAIQNSEAIFICVGTPQDDDGHADLRYLFAAIDQILQVPNDKFQVIITKSTVPPSTVSEKVIPYVGKKSKETGHTVGFASNPEFLREGYCWEDFIAPDRIVIGVEDDGSKEILEKIYTPFNAPIHYVSYNTSEFVKYLSNTLLSTMISYANEMSMVADAIGGIDVQKAFRVLHEDKRWLSTSSNMKSYVFPGCGYGGYCLPKDTSALAKIAEKKGYKTSILESNLKVNHDIKQHLVDKVTTTVGKDEQIGILGLSFKPESDDVRVTPAKEIISHLLDNGYRNIRAYDPIAIPSFKQNFPDIDIHFINSLEDIVEESDHLILVTNWKEFQENHALIKSKNLFDFRYAL